MRRTQLAGLISLPLWIGSARPCAAVTVSFDDEFNRASFNASQNGWMVQSYAKGKGSFGLIPASVNSNTNFRYSTNIDASGTASESNTVTTTAFALPAAGQYLEFSANLNLDALSASTPGLVFAVSAFEQDASNNQWATNYEFVTKQLNLGNQLAPNDRLLLTSFNNFSTTNPNNEWSEYAESGVNAAVGFHTYTMRLFTNEVDYLVDNKVIATTTSFVPTGHSLFFELNAFAPDSSWSSAEAPLPNNSSFHMDVDWGKVSYGTVGVPAWVGTFTTDPLVLKESGNWTNGTPATGNESVIDNSATVPATLYFGNASAGSVGITQTLGALTLNSSTLTALNANTGSAPATATTYGITFVGNAGNTVPLISLGANVTQAVSISDSPNAVLNLQIGTTGGSINVTNSAATLTLNSAITNATGITAAFNKVGAGLLVLNNTANSFGGIGQTISITAGTLSINADGELGNSANTITLNGGTLQVNPAAALTLARSVVVNPAGGTLNLPATNVTFSAPFSGSGPLTKSGTGELILNSGTGAYSGAITVNAGNLRLINPASIAAGTVVNLVGTPTGNSTLNLRADTDSTYPVNIHAVTNPVQIFAAPQDAGNSGHTLSIGALSLGATTLAIGGNTGYGIQSGAVTLTGNATITTNTAPLHIASIGETGGSRSFTKAGTNLLVLNGAGTYTGPTSITNGTLEIGAAGSLASTAITLSTGATLAVDSGATLASASNLTDNGSVTVGSNTGTGILSRTVRTLTLGSNGTTSGSLALATENPSVLTITGDGANSGLTFAGSPTAWHGLLDLGANDLLIKNGNLTNMISQLKAGLNTGSGFWNGSAGITSSAAATNTTFLTTLALTQNAYGDPNHPLPLFGTNGVLGTTFDGQPASINDVLVKYTTFGDADLNGIINGADYNQIDLGFAAHLTGWVNGDFNYDGVVDGSDFALIDNAFNQQIARATSSNLIEFSPSALMAGPISIPEPSTLAILTLGAFAGLRRSRRWSREDP